MVVFGNGVVIRLCALRAYSTNVEADVRRRVTTTVRYRCRNRCGQLSERVFLCLLTRLTRSSSILSVAGGECTLCSNMYDSAVYIKTQALVVGTSGCGVFLRRTQVAREFCW